jgi:signal transduction histidine kinase
VTIRATISHNRLSLDIEDDGVGGAEIGPGSGLVGILDRLDVLGGRLTIKSVPGAGTGLSLELPCEW